MQFDLDARTTSLGVGDFAEFSLGPRDGGDGAQGLWRAQLGTHWHQELRKQTASEQPDAEFEVVIAGPVAHRGWTLTLTGRTRLADALNQLYVLLPVLDDAKHYWMAPDEVDKLIRAGEGWLGAHPDRAAITRRYLANRRALVRAALGRLADAEDAPDAVGGGARRFEAAAVAAAAAADGREREAVGDAPPALLLVLWPLRRPIAAPDTARSAAESGGTAGDTDQSQTHET